MSLKTVAFAGASGGCGLSALKHTLAAGYKCIALCRNPSKLTSILPPEINPNLQVVEGNARDVTAVSQCLKRQDGQLVDYIVFTIGGKFMVSGMTIDDPDVCKDGIATLLEAIAKLREAGATGRPYIIAMSSTGLSKFGRDVPLVLAPLYHVALRVPHRDKKIMEEKLVQSGENFTIVRASLLVDGETDKVVRFGVEDPKTGRESKAIGYTISREDTGKWIAKNIVLERDAKFENKIAFITY